VNETHEHIIRASWRHFRERFSATIAVSHAHCAYFPAVAAFLDSVVQLVVSVTGGNERRDIAIKRWGFRTHRTNIRWRIRTLDDSA
jgi:hypothetical protein